MKRYSDKIDSEVSQGIKILWEDFDNELIKIFDNEILKDISATLLPLGKDYVLDILDTKPRGVFSQDRNCFLIVKVKVAGTKEIGTVTWNNKNFRGIEIDPCISEDSIESWGRLIKDFEKLKREILEVDNTLKHFKSLINDPRRRGSITSKKTGIT